MKIATREDWGKAEENIIRTLEDTIGDIVVRTKKELKQMGFTHYLSSGSNKPKELD